MTDSCQRCQSPARCEEVGHCWNKPQIKNPRFLPDVFALRTEDKRLIIRNFGESFHIVVMDAKARSWEERAREAMQEFVDQCDLGEVRPRYTYDKFKKLLEQKL